MFTLFFLTFHSPAAVQQTQEKVDNKQPSKCCSYFMLTQKRKERMCTETTKAFPSSSSFFGAEGVHLYKTVIVGLETYVC